METSIIFFFNNDGAIIDYLADLQNHTPLTMLTIKLREDKGAMLYIIDDHPTEGVITLTLANVDLLINQGDNKLILCVHPNINVLIAFFLRWMERSMNNDDVHFRLSEIVWTLQEHQKNIHKEKYQPVRVPNVTRLK